MLFRSKYLFLLSFLSAFACKTTSNLSDMDWVLGKWQVNESRSFEEWTKVDESLYRGIGYKVRKNDTLVTETIEIVQRGEALFYIPSVSDQNDGNPIEFKLVSKKRDEFIFENEMHDFPQRIIYEKLKNGEIDARIEGKKQGFFSEVKFKLKRIN